MAPTETLAEQHFRTLEVLLAAEPVPATLLTSATPAQRRRETARLARVRPAAARGRHPRPDRGRRSSSPRWRSPWSTSSTGFGGAPAARALDAKGPWSPGATRPSHDRDADPADPVPDRIRRPSIRPNCASCRRGGARSARRSSTKRVAPGAYEFIRERPARGAAGLRRLAPLVSESADSEATRSGGRGGAALRKTELRDFRVELLHGQLPSDAKGAGRWERFRGRTTPTVLVATTVIEGRGSTFPTRR